MSKNISPFKLSGPDPTNNLATPDENDSMLSQSKIPKINNNMLNIYRYSGAKNESLVDWLRQFKNFTRLYDGFTEHNLHFYASSYLIGDAGRFYDDITPEPKIWSEFVKHMEARFGEPVLDKPGLYRKILGRFQKEEENTKEFCQELYKLGEKAEMDEELIVQTIISNMKERNRIFYRLHVNNEFTFRKLLKLIDVVEFDQENRKIMTKKILKRKDHLSEIADKLDMLTLSLKKNDEINNARIQIRCTKCHRTGHSQYDCYSLTKDNYKETNNQQKNSKVHLKLRKLCSLIGEKITGDMANFKKKIKKPSKIVENLLTNIPSQFDAFQTLKRNKFLLDEIIKCFENNNIINNINLKKSECSKPYDVITVKLKIENIDVNSIIDTGACLTIISESLADKLKQPILFDHRTALTMANNHVTFSSGMIKSLPIMFEDVVFPIDALVLKDAAQDLLIGSDWLLKYKTIINLESGIISVPIEDKIYIQSRIQGVDYTKDHIKNYYNYPNSINIKASEKIVLKPYEMKKSENDKLPYNCLLYVDNKNEENYLVGKGIYDIAHPPTYILAANYTQEEKIIQKNENVANAKIIKNNEIIFPEYQTEFRINMKKHYKTLKERIK
ncbi:hypothetical protein GVAV_002774 [Gurleya vavrai]